MHYTLLSLALAANSVVAYPFMGSLAIPNAEKEIEVARNARRQLGLGNTPTTPKLGLGQILNPQPTTCPYNPNHVPAPPVSSQYPYLGAIGTLTPGTGKGGIEVPAPGDTDHMFIAPNFTTDIRGPCPGLNAAANHGFLARDGITTFDELVAAQQNMYNAGYDLAVVLAVAGVELDGDTVTGKMSLGCEATSRTATDPTGLVGTQPGLDGHNKFEADTSLSRNDYFLGNGDDYRINGSLMNELLQYCGDECNVNNLGHYRAERWRESQATNPNFFFGPGSLLLYGAASFLYELFPGSNYAATPDTMMSFFGVNKTESGDFKYVGERPPPGWKNRVAPYTLMLTGNEIGKMYQVEPEPFGGNVGQGNFNGEKDNFTDPSTISPSDFTCFLYQLVSGGAPSEVNGFVGILNHLSSWALGKLNPIFKNLGCPDAIY